MRQNDTDDVKVTSGTGQSEIRFDLLAHHGIRTGRSFKDYFHFNPLHFTDEGTDLEHQNEGQNPDLPIPMQFMLHHKM